MNASVTLATLLSLTGLVVLIGWLWRDYYIDLFRQRMFALRDELFDLAATRTAGVTFDAKLYHQLRTTLNGKLRFADRHDSIAPLIFLLRSRQEEPALARAYADWWEENAHALPAEAVARLNDIRDRMHRETAAFIFASTPHISALTIPGFALYVIVVAFTQRAPSTEAFRGEYQRLRHRANAADDAIAFHEGCVAA